MERIPGQPAPFDTVSAALQPLRMLDLYSFLFSTKKGIPEMVDAFFVVVCLQISDGGGCRRGHGRVRVLLRSPDVNRRPAHGSVKSRLLTDD